MRGVKRFQAKGKLASRFVGPYPIIGKRLWLTDRPHPSATTTPLSRTALPLAHGPRPSSLSSPPVTSPAQTPPIATLSLTDITPTPVELGTASPSLCTVRAPSHAACPERSHPRCCAPSTPPLCPSPVPAGFWLLPAPGAYKRDHPRSTSPRTGLGHSLSPPLDSIELGVVASLLFGELLPPLSGGLESN
jgi:hypothetical protein